MKIIVRPLADPAHEIDVTNRLVSAIADELWRVCGGNQQLNWLEAELHLQEIVAQASREAQQAEVFFVAEDSAPPAGTAQRVSEGRARRTVGAVPSNRARGGAPKAGGRRGGAREAAASPDRHRGGARGTGTTCTTCPAAKEPPARHARR
jgi:hypothetical protein